MVTPRPSPDSRRLWLAGAALAVLTLLAYLPALRGGFIWDDDNFLTLNPLIRAPDGLYRFWFTTQPTDYWPVTSTLLWFEWRLWGLDPAGYHAVNVALHVAEVLLLWSIFRRLRLPGAFLGALLFALHPVNVESVAWIAQCKNLVAMLFFLLSLSWFLQTGLVEPGPHPMRRRAYALCLGAFLLALLSKGSVAPLPLVLLGLVAWRRRLTLRDALWSAPFLALAAVLAGVNVWFQTHGESAIRQLGWADRLVGAGRVGWFYLGKALWPARILFIYPQWHPDAGRLAGWLPLLAAAVVTGGLARLSRPALFAWGYFWVMLIPVLGFADIAFMEYSPVANHYAHLALIGVVGLAAVGWSAWAGRQRRAALAGSALVVAALFTLTWRQNQTYRSLESLYRTTLADNPDAWVAHGNLGSLLAAEGRLPEAIPELEEALRLRPDYPQARVALGSALANTGHLAEAGMQFAEAVRLRPDFAEGHYNLALVLEATGQPQAAMDHLETALRIKPDLATAHNALGILLAQSGQRAAAISHFETALQVDPGFAAARANLEVARRQP
jgi:tetratricopeptide (TPR) repeat protein